MARKPFTGVAVVIGLVALFASCMLLPAYVAVERTILLVTSEPVRVTEVECVSGSGRSSGHCDARWTFSNGDTVTGRLTDAAFVGDGDTFDGYGNRGTASPSRITWILAQLLYLIPLGIIAWFIRFHRRRLKTAGRPLSSADEAAMNARAEELRNRRDEPPAVTG